MTPRLIGIDRTAVTISMRKANMLNPVSAALSRRKPLRKGFTLIELVVVIGIVLILIGMLLPIIRRSREQAYLVKCLSNLRSIGQAAQQHANEHGNYLPAAGWHWECIGGTCNPKGMEDPQQKRYMYYSDEKILRPLPITAAIAFYMSVKVRTDSREHLADDLNAESMRRLFRCPSQFKDYSGWTERGDDGGSWVAPDSWSGYDFNAALLGRRDYNTKSCPKGLLSRVKQPAKVFFALDGRPRDGEGLRYLQLPDDNENQTLYDVQQSMLKLGNGAEALDFGRHTLQLNVLFCDWHCETIAMGLPPAGGDGLRNIGVSQGIGY